MHLNLLISFNLCFLSGRFCRLARNELSLGTRGVKIYTIPVKEVVLMTTGGGIMRAREIIRQADLLSKGM